MAITNTTTLIKQLSDGGPDGTSMGQSTSDKISFYGVTPLAQQSSAALASTTALAGGACTFMGSIVSAVMNQATQFNTLVTDLRDLGLIA